MDTAELKHFGLSCRYVIAFGTFKEKERAKLFAVRRSDQ